MLLKFVLLFYLFRQRADQTKCLSLIKYRVKTELKQHNIFRPWTAFEMLLSSTEKAKLMSKVYNILIYGKIVLGKRPKHVFFQKKNGTD